MQTLDYWRCPACSRILAEQVVVGGIGSLTAVCWGCGVITTLGSEPPTLAAFHMAAVGDKAIDAMMPPKKGKP